MSVFRTIFVAALTVLVGRQVATAQESAAESVEETSVSESSTAEPVEVASAAEDSVAEVRSHDESVEERGDVEGEGAATDAATLPEALDPPLPTPTSVSTVATAAPPEVPAEAETVASPAEVPAEAEPETPSPFSYVVFADAYMGVSNNLASSGRAPGPSFAFAPENGVGLAFAGGDLRYDTQYFGVAIDGRVGSAVPSLLGSDLTLLGSAGLKQAFVSVRPHSSLSIDVGQFDTIYGGEVSESWKNPNYTRGALYFIAQPFFHTGLRVSAELPRGVRLNAIAVQGWNSVVDNNEGKSFGAQLAWSGDNASFSAGYIGGPEQSSMVDQSRMPGVNGRWRHLVDVVAGVEAGPLSFLFNGDYISEEVSDGVFSRAYGAMLTVRYDFAPFALAVRGEVLNDADGLFLGVPNMRLGTGTVTFEAAPVDGLILRLDARYDAASEAVFASGSDEVRNDAFRVVLGAVVRGGN